AFSRADLASAMALLRALHDLPIALDDGANVTPVAPWGKSLTATAVQTKPPQQQHAQKLSSPSPAVLPCARLALDSDAYSAAGAGPVPSGAAKGDPTEPSRISASPSSVFGAGFETMSALPPAPAERPRSRSMPADEVREWAAYSLAAAMHSPAQHLWSRLA